MLRARCGCGGACAAHARLHHRLFIRILPLQRIRAVPAAWRRGMSSKCIGLRPSAPCRRGPWHDAFRVTPRFSSLSLYSESAR
jgi:hypothetical protein